MTRDATSVVARKSGEVARAPHIGLALVGGGGTGRRDRQLGSMARMVGLGAVLGIAWSASMRGWMAEQAGSQSTVTWVGTFAAIIAPGAVVGALLGWAEYLLRTGRDRGRGWLAFAPLLFPIAVVTRPGGFATLLTTGLGGGAIGMVVLAMVGGIALSGRGSIWLRIPCGVLAFAVVPAVYLGPPMRPELDPATPLGAWSATLFSALFVTLTIACAIPLRPCDRTGTTAPGRSPADR